MLLDVKVKIND